MDRDRALPRGVGAETFSRLKEIDPEVKVLLSSGYSIEGEAREFLKKGCKGFIQKPYNITDLSRTVRDLIEG